MNLGSLQSFILAFAYLRGSSQNNFHGPFERITLSLDASIGRPKAWCETAFIIVISINCDLINK